MARYNDYLTASDYYKFLLCPLWPYYDRHATEDEREKKRAFSESEKTRMEDGMRHEKEIIDRLFKDQGMQIAPQIPTDPEAACQATLALMKEGAPYIYQGTLTHEEWTGRPDLLMRVEGESSIGVWHYLPIDIKSAHQLQKYHCMQLMFYAVLLEALQGRFPGIGKIINRDGDQHEVVLGERITEFEEITQELERIRAGEKPEPVFRKTCLDNSPWGAVCQQYAEERNDIALVFNVNVKRLESLRNVGIRTVSDAAELDPDFLEGKEPGLTHHGLEVIKMQAQSLQDRKVFIRRTIELDVPEMEIHFDIESDPPNDLDYLFGFYVRQKGEQSYRAFVARKPEEEEKMWREFLAWIETLPESCQIIHYASYEQVRLRVLEMRYGGSEALDRFRERMVDLKQIVTSSIIIPTYFYGLKYVAPFLGYKWRGEVHSGGESIDFFEKFLEEGDEEKLNQILLYNEDDVRATALIADWMRAFAGSKTHYDPPYPWESEGIPNGYESE